MNCRHCGLPLRHLFLDLGFAPPSNAYRDPSDLQSPEKYYPLRVFVCDHCWLVQTEDYTQAEDLFNDDYAYFSSVSQTWLDHARAFSEEALGRFGLDETSLVVEIAANDGYLLRNFVVAGIPCLGIEPTASTAERAEEQGIPIVREFFGRKLGERLAGEERKADLLVGNNVYAHVPDINDFTLGMKRVLAEGGTISLEFPHLANLIRQRQFDTVYHEHFSYLSLHAVSRVFSAAGLRVWDVEELPTHGGSLRVFGCHEEDGRNTRKGVRRILDKEIELGLLELSTYQVFQSQVETVKHDLLSFLLEQKRTGKSVAAYGAAAKGNTLLNYAGVKPDLLPYVCDAAPSKQGKFLPGSHIPILAPEELHKRKPDFVLILPWNIASEISTLHDSIRDWGGRFAVAIPEFSVFD